MSAIEHVTPIGLDALIDAAKDLIQREGITAVEATDRLFPIWRLTTQEKDELIRTGLTQRIGHLKWLARGTEEAWVSRPAVRQVTPTGADLMRSVLDLVDLPTDVTGTVKTFRLASLADLDATALYYDAQIKGATPKRNTARGAARLLREHGVDTVAELPADALARVERWVGKAWG